MSTEPDKIDNSTAVAVPIDHDARRVPQHTPVYKEVERILDEESAWIARPSDEVTRRVALAATVAALRLLEEAQAQDARDVAEIEARVRPTICPTFSSDGGNLGLVGRISAADFDALVAK